MYSAFPSRSGPKKYFSEKVSTAHARRRALKEGRVLLGDILVDKDGKILTAHKKFPKVLEYCLNNAFEEYVFTDNERVAFLQGFFEVSTTSPVKDKNGIIRYKITRKGRRDFFDRFAKTFFELGIFPRLDLNEETIYIQGVYNLHTMQSLHLDRNKKNRAAVSSYILNSNGQGYTSSTYYPTRQMVKMALRMGTIKNWMDIARTIDGPDEDTIKGWVSDLVKPLCPDFPYLKRTPLLVQRYEALLDHFNLPNVFEEEVGVCVGENFLFNVDGIVYRMPLSVQQSYFAQVPEQSTEDALVLLHEQLYSNLDDDENTSIVMEIDDDNIIRSVDTCYPYYSTLTINTYDGPMVFTHKALFDYFVAYGLEIADITDDDVECLREQFDLRGDKGGDLTFTFEDHLVHGVSLRSTPTGANRWQMWKSYTGMKLRETQWGGLDQVFYRNVH